MALSNTYDLTFEVFVALAEPLAGIKNGLNHDIQSISLKPLSSLKEDSEHIKIGAFSGDQLLGAIHYRDSNSIVTALRSNLLYEVKVLAIRDSTLKLFIGFYKHLEPQKDVAGEESKKEEEKQEDLHEPSGSNEPLTDFEPDVTPAPTPNLDNEANSPKTHIGYALLVIGITAFLTMPMWKSSNENPPRITSTESKKPAKITSEDQITRSTSQDGNSIEPASQDARESDPGKVTGYRESLFEFRKLLREKLQSALYDAGPPAQSRSLLMQFYFDSNGIIESYEVDNRKRRIRALDRVLLYTRLPTAPESISSVAISLSLPQDEAETQIGSANDASPAPIVEKEIIRPTEKTVEHFESPEDNRSSPKFNEQITTDEIKWIEQEKQLADRKNFFSSNTEKTTTEAFPENTPQAKIERRSIRKIGRSEEFPEIHVLKVEAKTTFLRKLNVIASTDWKPSQAPPTLTIASLDEYLENGISYREIYESTTVDFDKAKGLIKLSTKQRFEKHTYYNFLVKAEIGNRTQYIPIFVQTR